MAINRRSMLQGGAALSIGASIRTPALATQQSDVVVIGAGVFGAWTAYKLALANVRVTLVDAWGPAHARASSGGESRMTRGSYGQDEVYTRMAWASLAEWQSLSRLSGLPIFHKAGVLFFSPEEDSFVRGTIAVHERLKLPTQVLDRAAMTRRYPQIDFSGVEVGLYEPEFGALMARRAVQTLVAEFVKIGGTYIQAAVQSPEGAPSPLRLIRLGDGRTLSADRFVFACGPWLPKLFPQALGNRIFPTRQEVFFFAPREGDTSFSPGRLPGWADFNGGDIYYGFPDLEARGFKIAHDAHGPPMDPDSGDRTPSPQALADVRAFMERRFPALRGRPLNEARVCQYENSANGDLLIDLHPEYSNVALVGAGSGHGFKHGPAVGLYASKLIMGTQTNPEPRFSLASKGERQQRSVH